MQVSNVIRTCRRLIQLLILYLQLSQTTIIELYRLTAVTAIHNDDWIIALVITSCGFRMEDDAIRVAVDLH